MDSNTRLVLAFFVFLSVVFLFPVFQNITYLGSYDWDQHFFYHGAARESIVKFHQFPFWNPFYCGGSPLLANPQSVFLSPFFLFVLLFGTVIGLKLEILAYFFIGLLGMYFLCRNLGLRQVPSVFASVIFMCSSWFAARVAVGHTTFFPFAFLPWVFLLYLKSFSRLIYAFVAALLLDFAFFAGGVYPAFFISMFLGLYAVLQSWEQKTFRPLKIVALILVLFILIGSVKLIPMLEFTHGLSFKDTQLTGASYAFKGLLWRDQALASNDALINSLNPQLLPQLRIEGKAAWGWHEYSFYVGLIPLLLALLAFLTFRKSWKFVIAGLVFFVMSLGDFSPLPVWHFLKEMPDISALHGPSRILILVAFCVAILAARAINDIRQLSIKWVSMALLAIVLIDLLFVSRPLVQDVFTAEPFEINTKDYTDYIHLVSPSRFQIQYPLMLQNADTVNCYERIHPAINVIPSFYDNGEPYPGAVGNAFYAGSNVSINLSYFSPNRVDIKPTGQGTLVFNQNYFPGWSSSKEVFPYHGLVAVNVTAQDSYVSLYYIPSIFYISLALSVVGLLLGFFVCLKWQL